MLKPYMLMANYTFILFFFTLYTILIISTAVDTITVKQNFTDDGNDTIDSIGGVFQLGFFSPGSSKNRYLGIWYINILPRTVVWVANRDTPLTDTSGVVRVDLNGSLSLFDGTGSIIWTTNSSRSVVDNTTVAQLFDSGNLVVKNENDGASDNYFWQSFDHPGDHILPTQRFGFAFGKVRERYLTSWKSADDPSPGNYTFRVNIEGYPQIVEYDNSDLLFRFGPWDNVQFNGVPFSLPDLNFLVSSHFDGEEVYYSFNILNSPVIVRLVLNPDGNAQVLTWKEDKQSWESNFNSKGDACDQYALCGAYGSCNSKKRGTGVDGICGCLKGYEPKFPEKWKVGVWSDGCVRKTQFSCGNGDKFFKFVDGKFPDARNATFNTSMNLEQCKNECIKNCSCTAYSNIDIRVNGNGCMLWFNELIDIRDYSGPGLDFFVKIAASELEGNSRTKRRVTIIVVPLIAVLLALLLGLSVIYFSRKRTLRKKGIVEHNGFVHENTTEELDLPLYDFMTIASATGSFSLDNKLGKGGFGTVYKGMLEDNQEIAVKRLSKESRQGLDEFKNEVSLIAKLQHRNLVKLLGCSIKEGEMLLIYEYMPNNSLDSVLFDQELSKTLDWPMRYNIINGIARGLLYLHQDSRLRIIHRDLKPSNVLLDHEMNPRISDFGLAKSFTGSETEANTTKVVGTFGYMSPEYALDGTFSVKSDVYSFGVILLEIVSGKKMGRLYHSDQSPNLLTYAWTLYEERKLSELIDSKIVDSYDQFEAFRAIQIGLLCVNTNPKDRPSMSFVVSMMTSETELPQPMQPAYIGRRSTTEPLTSSSTSNTLSVSFFGPR